MPVSLWQGIGANQGCMKMFAIAAALVALTAIPAQARADDPLARCLKARTSAADRTVLVRWMFVGMSNSAAVKDMVKVSEAQRVEANQRAGKLLERLLVRDCRTETIAQMKADPQALQRSFSPLGETAMQDLMRDPEVAKGFSGVIQYIDMTQLMTVLLEGSAFGN
jgi:hypothetical protein